MEGLPLIANRETFLSYLVKKFFKESCDLLGSKEHLPSEPRKSHPRTWTGQYESQAPSSYSGGSKKIEIHRKIFINKIGHGSDDKEWEVVFTGKGADHGTLHIQTDSFGLFGELALLHTQTHDPWDSNNQAQAGVFSNHPSHLEGLCTNRRVAVNRIGDKEVLSVKGIKKNLVRNQHLSYWGRPQSPRETRRNHEVPLTTGDGSPASCLRIIQSHAGFNEKNMQPMFLADNTPEAADLFYAIPVEGSANSIELPSGRRKNGYPAQVGLRPRRRELGSKSSDDNLQGFVRKSLFIRDLPQFISFGPPEGSDILIHGQGPHREVLTIAVVS